MKSFLSAVLFGATLMVPAVARANDVKVTFRSIPEGATLFTVQSNGLERAWGTAPYILKWEVPRRWNTCITTESVKVRWVSGIEVTVSGVEVCPQNGKKQEFVFQRPNNLPGVELDVQYAIALMQSAAAAASARERADAAYAAAIVQAFQQPRQKICTSNIIGNQVFTYCY